MRFIGFGVRQSRAALAQSGYFPHDEIMTLRKIDSPVEGHPNMRRLPGTTVWWPDGDGASNDLIFTAKLQKHGHIGLTGRAVSCVADRTALLVFPEN